MLLNPNSVEEAFFRTKNYLHNTPILHSQNLNNFLGNNIYFKCDNFQKTGAFKVRGAFNALLKLKEQNKLPKKVIAYSSGNHGQAVAYVAKALNLQAEIFLPDFISSIKLQATRATGARVTLSKTRKEAEGKANLEAQNGAYLLKPFDDDMVIEGQGTAAYEVFKELKNIDYVFATCGGGGWLSGTYLAKELLSPKTKIIGCEPKNANDAFKSLKSGKIFAFDTSPNSIADGARTLSVVPRTFEYLKKLDGFNVATEKEIKYWTQWINHLLKISVEPTSALSMAVAYNYIKKHQLKNANIVILISGGNVSRDTIRKIWQKDYLVEVPKI